jgi:hypothetical protein
MGKEDIYIFPDEIFDYRIESKIDISASNSAFYFLFP